MKLVLETIIIRGHIVDTKSSGCHPWWTCDHLWGAYNGCCRGRTRVRVRVRTRVRVRVVNGPGK